MDDIQFIQQFYYYFLTYFSLIVVFSFFYSFDKRLVNVISILTFFLAIVTTIHIGNREIDIGVDTKRYEASFLYYKGLSVFEVRKDFLFDFMSFLFSKIGNFKTLLFFCSFLYVFLPYISFRKIFGDYFFLPFVIFLVSPYFVANGISAIRSGLAASIFIYALSLFYSKGKFRNGWVLFLSSVFMHISMIVPLGMFVIANYFRGTKIVFICWLCSIVLGYLNINFIVQLVEITGIFDERIGNYAVNEGSRNFWGNFFIFGFGPVLFGIYNVYTGFKDEFYKRILNGYMLSHIPYIILLESEYGLRLGYLAEFMMPILIAYPIIHNPVFTGRFTGFKAVVVLFVLFIIKAYKILII